MNITKYLFGLGVVAAMGLTSCSNDEPAVSGPVTDANEAFYATVTLSLPQGGSRSQTDGPGSSNDGIEPGKDYENQIKSILVVIATQNASGDYVLQTVSQGDANANVGAAAPTYTIKFNNTAITELVKQNAQVYPFVICNPSADMVAKFTSSSTPYIAGSTAWVNDIVTLSDPDNFNGWRKDNFLMTNAQIGAAMSLPAESELKNYTSSNNPYNLTNTANGGPIKVERTVARFDFKSTQKGSLPINTYEIKDAAQNLVGSVTLTDMALINMGQDFYTFRRVSNDGTSTDWTIGGLETPVNYMVSPNSDDLSQRNFLLAGFNANGVATVAPSSFDYTSLSAFTSTTDHTIWRYATENAIPGVNNQKKGLTTGVVFKGQVTFADGEVDTDKAVYKFGTTIYGNLEHLIAEIKANPGTYMAAKAKDAGIYEVDATTGELINFVTEADEADFNTASGAQLAANDFTMFRPNGEGSYDVYYYYWNRHNDNLDPNTMGIMEFGVVRNNVYRLAVNNIYNFGHPGDPGDDPDPENPDDPDENSNLYISLDVEVLPWVVRVNNIEF